VATVRDVTYDLFRRHGMTTMFGNPGSTELPMLGGFPDDFRYVLGLQEAVAVGMADGYAQASGTVGHVNLHTAPGVGNGMGAIFNAQANHTPLLVTAGQQARELMTLQANLTNRDATRMPHPLVKWSYEPPRAADVPLALGRAIHLADTPGKGAAFVSIPMDDWEADVAGADAEAAVARKVAAASGPDPDAMNALATALESAANPVFVAGPDIDAAGAWEVAVALVERQRLPVFAAPAPGGGRLGFPEGHPNFRGVLPPAIGPVADTLKAHDLILVVGSSVFPYYPNIPGPLLPDGAELVQITSDPDEAARAPMGNAIVGDVKLALLHLLGACGESSRDPGESLPEPTAGEEADPITGTAAMNALGAAFPADGIVVLEAPSATLALRNQLRISRPGSYYFGAGGGLGFGLAAAVGVQLAQPERPVVCVVGEGSAQYAITALWSAAAYSAPITVVVLRNSEYAILKWFGEIEGVQGAPGLDLPSLSCVAVAEGYGVPAREVTGGRDELVEALREAIAAPEPRLLETAVAPGMWLF
jgi:benzoylformate decarboxylase